MKLFFLFAQTILVVCLNYGRIVSMTNRADKTVLEKIKKNITDYFSSDERIVAVYLHGSYSKGKVHPGSDIDLALLPDQAEKIDFRELLKMSGDLEIKLNRTIDIGVVSSKNLVYAKEVIYNGCCLLVKDKYKKEIYETTLLSMYTDFQYERREVLNAYRS